MPMGIINIKMSLIPKGINKIIYYHPGVSVCKHPTRVLVNTLPLVPWGYYFFPVSSITRFGGSGSEDECTFIITNTFIVTLFEASRTENEFYIILISSIPFVRRASRHCSRYMSGYRLGLNKTTPLGNIKAIVWSYPAGKFAINEATERLNEIII